MASGGTGGLFAVRRSGLRTMRASTTGLVVLHLDTLGKYGLPWLRYNITTGERKYVFEHGFYGASPSHVRVRAVTKGVYRSESKRVMRFNCARE